MSANVPESFVLVVQVVSVVQRERSSVQGDGGGGFTYRGTGFSFPVSVRTVHERETEVWVTLPDGTEDRLNFTDVDFPVREGHKLALLLGGREIWAIRNFTTSTTTAFVTAEHFAGRQKSYGLSWAGLIFIGIVVVIAVPFSLAEELYDLNTRTTRTVATVLALVATPMVLIALSRRAERKWKAEAQKVDSSLRDRMESLARKDLP